MLGPVQPLEYETGLLPYRHLLVPTRTFCMTSNELTFSLNVLFHLHASPVLEVLVRPTFTATYILKRIAATRLQTSPSLRSRERK